MEHQVRHPVALELGNQRQLFGGQGLVIEGPVGPGRRVVLRARGLQAAIELALWEVRRRVEHQVLEEVREPRLALHLVA